MDVGALSVVAGQIQNATNTNCDTYPIGSTYGTDNLAETKTVANVPSDALTAVLIYTLPGNRSASSLYAVQIAISRYGCMMWIRTGAGNDGYGPWKRLATAEPPTWYSLPLASGITGSPKYSIDQLGFVHLKTRVYGVSFDTVFATLPIGFRPKEHTIFIVAQSGGIGKIGAARLEIAVDGTLKITGTDAEISLSNWLDLNCVFAAV